MHSMRKNDEKTQHKNTKLRKIKTNCTVKGEIRNWKKLNGEIKDEEDRKDDDQTEKYNMRNECL